MSRIRVQKSARISAIVVDDNEVDRYLARRALHESDLVDKIKEFADGKEAFNYMQSEQNFERDCGPHPPPTLFLVDVNMPGMSGFGLIEALERIGDAGRLSDGRSLIVVMLTSSSYRGDRDRALDSTLVRDYVQKPINVAKFMDNYEQHYRQSAWPTAPGPA